MATPISVGDKKCFIRWFRDNCELKNRHGGWILDYLLQNDYLLINVHFVNDVSHYPKGILMTGLYSDGVDFRFHKNHVITNDIEKSFHDIRLHPNERMYIQINCNQTKGNTIYTSILEDQFFAHENKKTIRQDQEVAEQILQQTKFAFEKKNLQNKIDKALEEKNKDEFIKLSQKWNDLIEISNIKKE